jgi:hypothetical protein
LNDPMQDTVARRHNRQIMEMIPELRGLPYDVQQRLYKEALRATDPPKGCLSLTISFTAGLLLAVGSALFVVCLMQSFIHSRFNPGIPRGLIYAATFIGCLVISALLSAMFPVRRQKRMQKYLWGRLLWLCKRCGYDMTGNTSGRCPECGCEWNPVTREPKG